MINKFNIKKCTRLKQTNNELIIIIFLIDQNFTFTKHFSLNSIITFNSFMRVE